MMKNFLAVSTVALIAGIASNASAACGTVSVANMNWQSGELLAHVDKFILEHGFGCQVEFVPDDHLDGGKRATGHCRRGLGRPCP